MKEPKTTKRILVVIGSGRATRLEPISSFIPKMLVNSGQLTVLQEIINEYSKYDIDEAYLIVNSEHKNIVSKFLEREDYKKLDIKIRTHDVYDGSASAINSISEEIIGCNVIFNWSDIVPEFDYLEFGNNTVYTSGNNCRYSYDDLTKNVKLGKGGVIGIYQIANFSKLSGKPVNGELDLADCLVGEFKQQEIKVKDIGDFDKLSKVKPVISRAFNEVIFNDKIVTKRALNEYAEQLQLKEFNWYEESKNSHFKGLTPNVKLTDVLNLERIDGVPLFEFLDNLSEAESLKKVKEVRSLLKTKGKNIPLSVKLEDYKIEILKANSRIAEVIDVWSNMGISTFEEDLNQTKELVQRSFRYLTDPVSLGKIKYQFFHGDLNFSNILVQDSGDIRFIDPRGYFGNSINYGPEEYELAKILYGLSGYDKFNQDLTWAGMSNPEEVKVKIKPLPGFDEYYSSSPVRVKVWLGLIWLSLSGYFKNNPYKSVAAIYNGIQILESIPEIANIRFRDDKNTLVEYPHISVATVFTKCPSKWLLIDEETNERYRICKNGKYHWIKEE